MTELDKKKIRSEIRSIRINSWVNLFKGIAVVIGSVVLFLMIQRPESILNRKLSEESISRERAKLIFDLVLNEQKPEDVLFGLNVIEKAYPEKGGTWIEEIRNIFKTRWKIQNVNEQLFQIESSLSNSSDSLDKTKLDLQFLLRKQKYLLEDQQNYQISSLTENDDSGDSKIGSKKYYEKSAFIDSMASEFYERVRLIEFFSDSAFYNKPFKINRENTRSIYTSKPTELGGSTNH